MRPLPTSVTAIAVTFTDIPIDPAKRRLRTERVIVGCAMVTHSFRSDGSMRLLLQSSTRNSKTGDAELIDWIEARLRNVDMLVGYKLENQLISLAAKSNPKAHLAINEMATSPAGRCVDVAERNAVGIRRSLSATCHRAAVPILSPDPWLLRRIAPTLRRLPYDELANAAAAIWRLYFARHVLESAITPVIADELAKLDAWLAECCGRDRHRDENRSKARGVIVMHKSD